MVKYDTVQKIYMYHSYIYWWLKFTIPVDKQSKQVEI